MVQRGKEPNRGMWSLPGGKIEWGESTLQAAKRELEEETNLSPNAVHWHDKPFESTDSIIVVDGAAGKQEQTTTDTSVAYHFVISQCFGVVAASSTGTSSHPPSVQPLDDAMDVQWWDMAQVQNEAKQGRMTPGVVQVVERAELLFTKGLFLCS
jgi:ADP-ribose pyrophosphatase YjhB (NUDIX family)